MSTATSRRRRVSSARSEVDRFARLASAAARAGVSLSEVAAACDGLARALARVEDDLRNALRELREPSRDFSRPPRASEDPAARGYVPPWAKSL